MHKGSQKWEANPKILDPKKILNGDLKPSQVKTNIRATQIGKLKHYFLNKGIARERRNECHNIKHESEEFDVNPKTITGLIAIEMER